MINTTFNWIDCIVFISMICFGSLIGIYMGCFHHKSKTANEYLLAGKNMMVIPVAMSLVATFISGITLLSIPAEAYLFGGSYLISCISMMLVVLITSYLYLPVFLKLNITSTYEYLERRFDLKTRQLASLFYGISQFLYLPLVIYMPAIAFSSVTQVNFNYTIIIFCAICILYTTIGGLKGVIWSDTLQLIVMVGSLTAILIAGTISCGGFTAVWNKALEGQRLDIFNMDPTERQTAPILILGTTIHFLSYFGVSQSFVQKFLALPSLQHAKRSLGMFFVMYCLVIPLCVFTGFVIFGKYADCDPIKSKLIKKSVEIVPFYVADISVDIPGLLGLFLAGIFSGSLSTLSSDLNCVSGVIYEDCFLKLVKISQKWETFVLKTIVIITGITIGILALLVNSLGGIWWLAFAVMAISTGPILGICTCGILLPKVNSNGAFYGALVATICVSSIAVMTKYYEACGYVVSQKTMPLSTKNCHLYNISVGNEHSGFSGDKTSQEQPFILFRISQYYYSLIGTLITIVIGCIVSYFFKNNDKPVERNLLSPIIYSLLSPEPRNNNDETSLNLLNHKNQN